MSLGIRVCAVCGEMVHHAHQFPPSKLRLLSLRQGFDTLPRFPTSLRPSRLARRTQPFCNELAEGVAMADTLRVQLRDGDRRSHKNVQDLPLWPTATRLAGWVGGKP